MTPSVFSCNVGAVVFSRTSTEVTVTVPGIMAGDAIAGWSRTTPQQNGLAVTNIRVTAANTIVVQVLNITPASAAFGAPLTFVVVR